MKSKLYTLLFALAFGIGTMYGDSSFGSSEGNDFWLTFMNNGMFDPSASTNQFSPFELKVVVSARQQTHILVEVNGIPLFERYVFANETHSFDLSALHADIYLLQSEVAFYKGVHVYTDEPNKNFSCFCYSRNGVSGESSRDVSMIIPTNYLGKEYIVQTYPNDMYSSEFAIVATENNTTVSIKPAFTTYGGKTAYREYLISLNQGDAYLVASTPHQVNSANIDLSGSLISSNKPIAVFNGNQQTSIPFSEFNSKDYLCEQTLPVSHWGKEFYLAKMDYTKENYAIFTAAYDNTHIECKCYLQSSNEVTTNIYTLDKGQSTTPIAIKNTGVIELYVNSDKPVMCNSYTTSSGNNVECIGQTCYNYGDPANAMVPSWAHRTLSMNFCTLDLDPYISTAPKHYCVYMVTRTDDIGKITLDGERVETSLFHSFASNPEMSYASIEVTNLSSHYHLIETLGDGFVGMVYAVSNAQGYFYALGYTPDPYHYIHERRTICANDSIHWRGWLFTGNEFSNYGGTYDISEFESVRTNLPAGIYGDNIVYYEDSVCILSLEVLPISRVTEERHICQTEGVYYYENLNNGRGGFLPAYYTSDGLTRTDTLHTIEGCDSIVTLNYFVDSVYHFTSQYVVCQDQNEEWVWIENGEPLDTISLFYGDTTYQLSHIYHTSGGCDSTYSASVYVAPSYDSILWVTMSAKDSFVWRGTLFTGDEFANYGGTYDSTAYQNVKAGLPAGIYSDTTWYQTEFNGCDSIEYLFLKIISLPRFTISFAINDSNYGSVEGAGIYKQDAVASITAVPNYGYHFVQWSDGETANPRAVKITQDTSFVAEFAPNIYLVSTEVNNSGYGSTIGDAYVEYMGQTVLQAIPKYGYHFVRWNDGNSSNPRSVIVSKDITYTATFAKNKYIITKYTDEEQGTISGLTQAEYLDNVTLEAISNYGYHFTQWSDGNITNPRTIELTQDTSFTAVFAKNTYIVTTVTSNAEWGTTTGDDYVLYQEEAIIQAIPNYGYQFVCWNDGNSSNPRSLVVNEDVTYTATFAKNKYTITKTTKLAQGTISGLAQAEYLDSVTLEAIPEYGYKFVQWSDGVTNNPRTFVLTQDTTFMAEFAINVTGSCGDNNQLTWTFDSVSGTLAISGNGALNSNYTYGLQAPTQTTRLIIEEGVTSIGNYAFSGIGATVTSLALPTTLINIGNYAFAGFNNRKFNTLVLPNDIISIGAHAFDGASYVQTIYFGSLLEEIGEAAFNGCTRVRKMTCLAEITPNVGTDGLISISSLAELYVPNEYLFDYQIDNNWNRFVLKPIGATDATVTNNEVTVVADDNTATLTWPTSENADSYSIEITKDGVVFCTLIFNANGQLTGIAFAPSRNGQPHAPAATMTANGMQFTVTGLNSGTNYAFSVAAKNGETVLASYSGEFETTGAPAVATDLNNTSDNIDGYQKIVENGQILILRGNRTYTLTGQEVR